LPDYVFESLKSATITRNNKTSALIKKETTKTITQQITKNTPKNNILYKASKNKILQTVHIFSLEAIINKSALINKKWYKINTKVGNYTLSSIKTTSVILSYKKKKLLLSTLSKTKKLKFRNN
jgi:hypothetical protein